MFVNLRLNNCCSVTKQNKNKKKENGDRWRQRERVEGGVYVSPCDLVGRTLSLISHMTLGGLEFLERK